MLGTIVSISTDDEVDFRFVSTKIYGQFPISFPFSSDKIFVHSGSKL